MQLFLASSLCFVDDIIAQYYDIKGKTIGCVFNAAKEWGGEKAFWNQRDIAALEKGGATLVNIDISKDTHTLFETIDVLFVGGGATGYLAQLVKEGGFDKTIKTFLDQGGVYMGTSAGSMLCCKSVYDAEEKKLIKGLGFINTAIIPHRASEDFEAYRHKHFDGMYYHKVPYLMLTDMDILVVNGENQTIETSKTHTFEELDEMRATIVE